MYITVYMCFFFHILCSYFTMEGNGVREGDLGKMGW